MSHLRSRSSTLAEHLFHSCCNTEEDRCRVAKTGQLVPSGSLKFKAVRAKLGWVKLLPPSERFFTQKRVAQALRDLLLYRDIELPSVPGFSQSMWVQQQAKCLTKTLQRARKSVAMDPSCAETQAWTMEDRLDFNPMRTCITCRPILSHTHVFTVFRAIYVHAGPCFFMFITEFIPCSRRTKMRTSPRARRLQIGVCRQLRSTDMCCAGVEKSERGVQGLLRPF